MSITHQRVAALLAVAVLVIATVVLVGGWILDIPALTTAGPWFTAGLSRTTALALIALSLSLTLLARGPPRPSARSVALVASILVGAVAATDLLLLIGGRPLGIEGIVFSGTHPSGIYMSPATAMGLVAASVCIVLVAVRATWAKSVFGAAATFGLVSASVALAGFAYDVRAFYEVSFFTAMAVHTAVGLLLLFVALLVLEPTWSWFGVVTGAGQGSQSVRRLLPAVLGAPFVLGWLALATVRGGVFSLPFALGLMVILSMALVSSILIGSGRLENAAESELRATNGRLERAVEHRDVLLKEVYHRTRNNLNLVDSMIVIERARTGSSAETEALERIGARVRALALVHGTLIHQGDRSHLDLHELLRKVAEQIADSERAPGQSVRIRVEADHDLVDIDRAVPIGLITNELITNALRHAYQDRSDGLIEVRYEVEGARGTLTVTDDGAPARSPDGYVGTGMGIVRSLVDQLRGSMTISTLSGTRVDIDLPRVDAVEGPARPRPSGRSSIIDPFRDVRTPSWPVETKATDAPA